MRAGDLEKSCCVLWNSNLLEQRFVCQCASGFSCFVKRSQSSEAGSSHGRVEEEDRKRLSVSEVPAITILWGPCGALSE